MRRSEHSWTRVFDRLGNQIGIKSLYDWYDVKISQIQKIGGPSLQNTNKLLALAYPKHEWKLWRFGQVPKGFWESKSNRVDCFDWLEAELAITKEDDWYAITTADVIRKGGGGLLGYFNYSISGLVFSIKPDHPWEVWKFQAVPKGFWKDKKNLVQMVENVGKTFKIKRLEEWYRVSVDMIQEQTSLTGLYAAGGLLRVLPLVYPQHEWVIGKIGRGYKASQWRLAKMLEDIFPQIRINLCAETKIFMRIICTRI